MNFRLRFCSGLTAVIFASSIFAQNKPSIAVADIDVQGISLAEKVKLKETISQQLFATRAFKRILNKSLKGLAKANEPEKDSNEGDENLVLGKNLFLEGETLLKGQKWS